MDWTDCSSKTGRYRVPPSSDFQTPPLAAPTKSVIFPEGSRAPAIAEMRPLIAAEPMLRAPKPEMVADLNEVSSARKLVAVKQIATPSIITKRVSLTLTLSQKERRSLLPLEKRCLTPTLFLAERESLLPLGEGEDEGSDQINRGSDLTSKPTEKTFCKRMIEKNYFVAVVGK